MKFLHTADLHKTPERWAEVEASLDVIEETGRREAVDLFVLAGDLYHGAEQNSDIGMHDPFAGRIQRLGNIAPVAIIEGTPSHDVPGSLDILERLACAHGITILRPGEAYALLDTSICKMEEVDKDFVTPKAILFGIPEPSKKWLLANGAATGKDEAAEAMRSAMRQLLLGLGAKRRQYPELPCVLLYHGQVRGCKLSNGTTLPDGPVSADDLRQVGADYYALGDIHEPQQIPGLSAYYPGSIYPATFGETHKAGCNLVELGEFGIGEDIEGREYPGFARTVTRVDFPHPQRLVIKADTYQAAEVAGKVVSFELTLSQSDRALFDADAALVDLLAAGALPGSRVKPNLLPVETVRAGEIAQKVTLEAKVVLWGENSTVEIPEGVKAGARALEVEVGSLGALAGPERRFRNISTRLRGSRGFWQNQRKDEVLIDWESCGEGVIAYVGPNGFGKTTSYDFAKPWPIPVSRGPKTLKNHFRLRDSAIENIYLEEVSGACYRTLINIDGANKSGGAEYYFFKGPGRAGPWEPYTQEAASGRQDGFFAAIDEVFGSMAIYMRTAFAAQKPSKDYPDLAEAPQSEKKQLIAELTGKDLSPYREAARTRGDALETALVLLDATIAAAGDAEGEIAEEEEAIRIHREDEARAQKDAEASTARGLLLKAEHETLSLRVAELDRQAERKAQLEREIAEIETALGTIEDEIAGFQGAAGGRARAVAELERIEALEARAQALRQEKAGIDSGDHAALVAHNESVRALGVQRQGAQSGLDGARRALADAEKAEALARAQVDPEAAGKVEAAKTEIVELTGVREAAEAAYKKAKAEHESAQRAFADVQALAVLVAGLGDGEACPLCGGADHPAPAHAEIPDHVRLAATSEAAQAAADAVLRASRAEQSAWDRGLALESAAKAATAAQEALAGLAATSEAARAAARAAQDVLDAIQIPPPPEPTPFPGAEELAGLEDELFGLDADAEREIIRKADEAAVRIEGAQKRKAEARARQDTLRAEVLTFSNPEGRAAIERQALRDKAQELEAERQTYTTATNTAAAAKASAEAAEKALILIRERAAKRDEAQAQRNTKAAELADWRLLERAIDGVRDLELDALAPSIADVATKLLQSSGREGHIEIDTTRIGSGSAKKAKQIEDFLIFHVRDDGERQDIATCSGGEMVWIRKALYDAFAVIRARNGNIKFMTAFLDETDGALFPRDRQDYFRMLEAAHEASGRYQTTLTTHSTEITAMAAQTLDVTTLGPREKSQGQEAAA